MTTAHVEKFAELVVKDPALLAKLGLDKVNADAAAASASAAAFITNAVNEAKAHGLEFTEDEARDFLASEANAEASGELSDTQLEAVAGGKGDAPAKPTGDTKLGLDIGVLLLTRGTFTTDGPTGFGGGRSSTRRR